MKEDIPRLIIGLTATQSMTRRIIKSSWKNSYSLCKSGLKRATLIYNKIIVLRADRLHKWLVDMHLGESFGPMIMISKFSLINDRWSRWSRRQTSSWAWSRVSSSKISSGLRCSQRWKLVLCSSMISKCSDSERPLIRIAQEMFNVWKRKMIIIEY